MAQGLELHAGTRQSIVSQSAAVTMAAQRPYVSVLVGELVVEVATRGLLLAAEAENAANLYPSNEREHDWNCRARKHLGLADLACFLILALCTLKLQSHLQQHSQS